jgi:glycosyltransferase involved in cell wall biosynthesis
VKLLSIITDTHPLIAVHTLWPACAEFAARGDHVTLIVLKTSCALDDLSALECGANFRIVTIGPLSLRSNRRFQRPARVAIARLIRESRPDVVHTWGWRAGMAGRSAALAEGKTRLVHTLLSMPTRRVLSIFRRRQVLVAERRLAADTDALISPSEWMTLDALQGRIGRFEQYSRIRCAPKITDRLPDPVAGGEFRRSLGLAHDALLVTQISDLEPDRGHDHLLRAAARLSDIEGLSIHFCFLGDGSLANSLKRRIAKTDHAALFHLPGRIDADGVVGAISGSDVIVHCAAHSGLPVPIPMAMLASRPVVCWDKGCSGELVDHDTGILLQEGDIPGLVEALRVLAEVPELREQLGDEGRRRCRKEFRFDRMITELAEVYDRL